MNQNDLMEMFKNGFKNIDKKNQIFICADCAEIIYRRYRFSGYAIWHVGNCEKCHREAYLTQLQNFK